MKIASKKICIIGCGNMGLIYAQLLRDCISEDEKNIVLIAKDEVSKSNLSQKKLGIVDLISSQEITESDILLLAVKPQDFSFVSQNLKGRIKSDALVISVMAGINVSALQNSLNHSSIIRAMPNAPAQYGKGVTVFCNSSGLSEEHAILGEYFLGLTGKTIKTENEGLLDSVTAISGSGPAYFFYLALQLKNAATDLGMDSEMAEILVRQTLIGSAEMVANKNDSLSDLIQTIASKGGTTEAALNHFGGKELNLIILEAIQKATERSLQLSANG
jgi:pyrroline-5-carboxylate reductase